MSRSQHEEAGDKPLKFLRQKPSGHLACSKKETDWYLSHTNGNGERDQDLGD